MSQSVMRKIEEAVRTAEQTTFFGKIEVEFKAGKAVYLRTQKQEKLDGDGEPRHDNQTFNR